MYGNLIIKVRVTEIKDFEMPSASIEEYLECIYKLSESHQPVKSNQIANSLGISAPSVAEMIKKMEEMGLVIKNINKSLTLTEAGEEKAINLIRKHRLSERFLADMLNISWDKVHDEACKFEHVLSAEAEEGLNRLLGSPSTCPHGHPIPGNAQSDQSDQTKLSELESGMNATIQAVAEDNIEILRYIGSLNLKPKTKVYVEEKAPFGGPLTLIVNDKEKVAIGPEIAELILVSI